MLSTREDSGRASVVCAWLLVHTIFALRYTLLSYLFGTVIVATTINLVAGLGQ